jgi:dienelactone hydrolase
MKTRTPRRLAALLLAAACLGAHATASSDDSEATTRPAAKFDPLLAPFLQAPLYLSMTLSPDGRHLAAIVSNGLNSGVLMMNADTLESNLILQPKWWKAKDYLAYIRNPRSATWLDNERIAVNFTIADGQVFGLDGTPGPDLMQGYLHPMLDAAGQPTDWHLVRRGFDPYRISRLNLRTGKSEGYDLDTSGDIVDTISDSRGDIRVVRTRDTAFFSDHTRIATWYRDNVGVPWQKIDDRSVIDDAFRPLLVENQPGHLVVQARNGGDRLAIWEFDVARRAFTDLLFGHQTEDVVGLLADESSGDFDGVYTDGLKRSTFWLDDRFARLQSSIDAARPGHVNVLKGGGADHVLVFSYSDVDPGRWFVLDEKRMRLREVARLLPSIDSKRMQPMRALNYPSFDGLSIPAYLTLPGKPEGPAPVVVLIHGGPQARDRWYFDPEVQILAAHGYAVFQPQFRGSTGFGKKFEEAGYGQWGLAMQDDITAGVKWLIEQKIADPQRICIVGASYGGYAALWGLEKTPELYKCGASVAGVSDLERTLRDDSDTSHDAVGRELMRHQLGDPGKIDFEAVSPLKHADRINVPVLLVHGARDVRVPISHGRKMRDALTALHKDVQWIEFPDEAHGISTPEDRRVYFGALFALLARTIGKGVPPLPPQSPAKSDEIPLTPSDAIDNP